MDTKRTVRPCPAGLGRRAPGSTACAAWRQFGQGDWPYLWLDATYLKVREGGRIVSVAAIIAMVVNTDGRREIVGPRIGPSEPSPSGKGS